MRITANTWILCFKGIDRGLEGCNVPVHRDDPSKPVPTGLNETNSDSTQYRTEYRVDPGDFLRFACDSGRILKTNKEIIEPEIIIQCRSNNTVAFRHETMYYDDFSCEEFPSFADIHVNSSAKRHLKRDIGKAQTGGGGGETPAGSTLSSSRRCVINKRVTTRRPLSLVSRWIRLLFANARHRLLPALTVHGQHHRAADHLPGPERQSDRQQGRPLPAGVHGPRQRVHVARAPRPQRTAGQVSERHVPRVQGRRVHVLRLRVRQGADDGVALDQHNV